MASLDRDRFLELLGELVSHGRELQNSPLAGLVPREELVADVVLAALEPHVASGAIRVQRLAGPGFEMRPSLVLTLPGAGEGSVGLVGAHFDVVPADREADGWTRDPFALGVEADGTLYGRGVTDCLGHVALATLVLRHFAEASIRPRPTLHVVLIANEEAVPVPGVGLDHVLEVGAMDPLRAGPIFWLDSTDFGPTVGTGGSARWDLFVEGVAGHSGMPHHCVNALELAMAVVRDLGEWFARTCPPHPEEERYGYPTPSSLKPTVVDAPNRSFTTIPARVQVTGDFRITPFYEIRDVLREAPEVVAAIDARLERGDVPPGYPRTRTADGRRGKVRLTTSERYLEGIACDLDSPGLRALETAMRSVRGRVERSSMTAALPLVRELQRRGFDVQITGFGITETMHAPDEHARLEDYAQGFAILVETIERL
jgi:acetylornithine deacetylase